MAFTALGIKEIKVKKKPKIIFFGTGNEIVDYKKKIFLPGKYAILTIIISKLLQKPLV